MNNFKKDKLHEIYLVYRTCLGSALNGTGKAKVVMHQTISDMIASVELQRPRVTPDFQQWDLGFVLQALSKPPCEPLREASFKHLTLKTVFLLAMASAGRRSELQALRFDYSSNQKGLVSHYTLAQSSCTRTRNRIRLMIPGTFQRFQLASQSLALLTVL